MQVNFVLLKNEKRFLSMQVSFWIWLADSGGDNSWALWYWSWWVCHNHFCLCGPSFYGCMCEALGMFCTISCACLIVLISYSLPCNKINLLGNFEVASSRCTLYIVHLPWCGQLDQNNSSGIHKLSYSNQEIYQNLNLDTNETWTFNLIRIIFLGFLFNSELLFLHYLINL